MLDVNEKNLDTTRLIKKRDSKSNADNYSLWYNTRDARLGNIRVDAATQLPAIEYRDHPVCMSSVTILLTERNLQPVVIIVQTIYKQLKWLSARNWERGHLTLRKLEQSPGRPSYFKTQTSRTQEKESHNEFNDGSNTATTSLELILPELFNKNGQIRSMLVSPVTPRGSRCPRHPLVGSILLGRRSLRWSSEQWRAEGPSESRGRINAQLGHLWRFRNPQDRRVAHLILRPSGPYMCLSHPVFSLIFHNSSRWGPSGGNFRQPLAVIYNVLL